MNVQGVVRGLSLGAILAMAQMGSAIALPPPEDIPEEVLQLEIITEARSPLNGEPLTAAQYAELQAQLAEYGYPPQVSAELQHLIFLLRVRRLLNTVIPFSPF
jgi:hypothetical protein